MASDVFALGVILYELATAKAAFQADNLFQVLDQIRSVDPDTMAAETPEPFASLLRQLLIADPDQRTITMKDVARHAVGFIGIVRIDRSRSLIDCLTPNPSI